MEIAHRRTKHISEWKPLRTTINQSTRYHIVNSLVPCKMKVYRKLNNEKTKRSHSNIAKRNRWINPLLPYKKIKKNKVEERNMYRNKKVAAKAKIISRRADRVNLNNLNGLIPPPDWRWFFCVRPAGWRRVSWTLFVNWFTWVIFRTVFGHSFRAGPPYNDQKWEPIYLFFLPAKIRAQYIYFATIFLNILGPIFGLILEFLDTLSARWTINAVTVCLL